jgi:hypothetical protein
VLLGKVWTAFLLFGAAASVIAWAVALCHENRTLAELLSLKRFNM